MATKKESKKPERRHTEFVDMDKLAYLMRYYGTLVAPLVEQRGDDRHTEGQETSPHVLGNRYLARCHRMSNGIGRLDVTYRKADSSPDGRWYAVQSVSLAPMFRPMRHTIARGLMSDLDFGNCHLRILMAMLEDEDDLPEESYSAVAKYAEEGADGCDRIRAELMEAAGCSKDIAKKVYLSLLNGGNRAYQDIVKVIRARGRVPPQHLEVYRSQIGGIHAHFAKIAKADRLAEYDAIIKRRQYSNRNYNHDGAWLNSLFLIKENEMLEALHKAIGSPENCVLCFDGIMVSKTTDLSKKKIKRFEREVDRATGVSCKLHVKKMNEHIVLPRGWADALTVSVPRFFHHHPEMLASKDEFTEDEIDRWGIDNIYRITGHGRGQLVIRDEEVVVNEDGWIETYTNWTASGVKTVLDETLDQYCNVVNSKAPRYAENRYHFKKPEHRLLGKYVKEHLYKKSRLHTKIGQCHVPYLRTPPDVGNNINIFCGFPILREKLTAEHPFEKSLIFIHWRDFFFREGGELRHFLNYVADMVQNPGRKPTNGVHIFFSVEAGNGKSWIYTFLCRLLGTKNVKQIEDVDKYVNNTFNAEYTGKIVKFFEEIPKQTSTTDKKWNKLKSQFEAKREHKRALYAGGVEQAATDRNILTTNFEPTMVASPAMARRCTVHHVKADKDDVNAEPGYWKAIWQLTNSKPAMRSAFEYFARYPVDDELLSKSLATKIRFEMLQKGIGSAVIFVLNLFADRKINDLVVDPKMPSAVPSGALPLDFTRLNEMYRDNCTEAQRPWRQGTLQTQLRKLGIKKASQLRMREDSARRRVLFINPEQFEVALRKAFRDPDFVLIPPEEGGD